MDELHKRKLMPSYIEKYNFFIRRVFLKMKPQQITLMGFLPLDGSISIRIYKKGFLVDDNYYRFSHVVGIGYRHVGDTYDLCIRHASSPVVSIAEIHEESFTSESTLIKFNEKVAQIRKAHNMLHGAFINYINEN